MAGEIRIKKDAYDYVASWASTREGAQNFAKALSHVAQAAERFPLKQTHQVFVASLKAAADGAASLLYMPSFVTGSNDFRHSLRACSRSDDFKASAKKAGLDGLSLANTGCDVMYFLDAAKLLNLGRAAPFVGTVFNLTSLVTDGVQLVEECRGSDVAAVQDIEQMQKKHRMVRVARCASSVAMAMLGLISLYVGTVVAAGWGFALSVTYLGTSIAHPIYDEVIKEHQKKHV
jgi:hypothetical protein